MRTAVPPRWAHTAVDLHSQKGFRVKAFRLTERQARELEAFTGQRDQLLGKPVVVTR